MTITDMQIWRQIERLLGEKTNDNLTVVSMLQDYLRLRSGKPENPDGAEKCACCGEDIPRGKQQVLCPWCASGIKSEESEN